MRLQIERYHRLNEYNVTVEYSAFRWWLIIEDIQLRTLAEDKLLNTLRNWKGGASLSCNIRSFAFHKPSAENRQDYQLEASQVRLLSEYLDEVILNTYYYMYGANIVGELPKICFDVAPKSWRIRDNILDVNASNKKMARIIIENEPIFISEDSKACVFYSNGKYILANGEESVYITPDTSLNAFSREDLFRLRDIIGEWWIGSRYVDTSNNIVKDLDGILWRVKPDDINIREEVREIAPDMYTTFNYALKDIERLLLAGEISRDTALRMIGNRCPNEEDCYYILNNISSKQREEI